MLNRRNKCHRVENARDEGREEKKKKRNAVTKVSSKLKSLMIILIRCNTKSWLGSPGYKPDTERQVRDA